MTQNQKETQAVREAGFPGYDKNLNSKCKRPEYYGICRVPEAQEAIDALDARPPARPRKDNRKFRCRITCRMPKTEYTLLQRAFAASTEKTMQDYTRAVLIADAKSRLEKKNAASDAGTSKAANES